MQLLELHNVKRHKHEETPLHERTHLWLVQIWLNAKFCIDTHRKCYNLQSLLCLIQCHHSLYVVISCSSIITLGYIICQRVRFTIRYVNAHIVQPLDHCYGPYQIFHACVVPNQHVFFFLSRIWLSFTWHSFCIMFIVVTYWVVGYTFRKNVSAFVVKRSLMVEDWWGNVCRRIVNTLCDATFPYSHSFIYKENCSQFHFIFNVEWT